MPRRLYVLLGVLSVVACMLPFRSVVQRHIGGAVQKTFLRKTVSDRLDQYGPTVRSRLAEDFNRVAISYPPQRVTLIGLKEEGVLEVWVHSSTGPAQLLRSYPILAQSGTLGPKTHEGDRQVPEGIYAIESLNPNSLYHLSLRLNYPNDDDRMWARGEGRDNLGGDIMIHGSDVSIGCLAMGDEAAEDLFILAADCGLPNIRVMLTPVDLRVRTLPDGVGSRSPWTARLYERLRTELSVFKKG